jgi:hypothetical protein
MAQVITTDLFDDWFRGLDASDKDNVAYYVDLLEQVGVTLDHPILQRGQRHVLPAEVSASCAFQAKGRPLRVFYRFDRRRNAIVLCGGNKQGVKEVILHAEAILAADTAYDHWLEYGAAAFELDDD